MAWRMWNVQSSLNPRTPRYTVNGMFGAHWYPGETMQAKCNRTDPSYDQGYPSPKIAAIMKALNPPHHVSEIPGSYCACGIYATKLAPDLSPGAILRQVMGVTEIWGNIITAEHGYRAQYARIRAFVTLLPDTIDGTPVLRLYGGPDLATIARDYQVPLLPSVEYAQREFFA
jgi:hypothetical protein